DLESESDREDDVFLDDDEISIHEDDVEIFLDGKYPEISFSKSVYNLIDQSMKKTLIVRLCGKTISYRALDIRIKSLHYRYYSKGLLRMMEKL
ncbi:hypothetical protein Goshw_006775, partial [Gossypium schwendimanii]|nr:hypothetical protein [Gossypium schwendimanii]